MLIVEGNVGVGKSTLCEMISKEYSIPIAHEVLDERTSVILEHFYKNKKEWAFTSQMSFLCLRMQSNNIVGDYIQDRSIFGDERFVHSLHQDGSLTDIEMDMLMAAYDRAYELMQPPSLLIYLDAKIDTLQERIIKRGREFEQAIANEYLEKLNANYLKWYQEYDLSPKVYIDTDKFDIRCVETTKRLLDEKIKRLGGKK